MTDLEDDVIRVINGLHAGEVATYGELVEEAGHPGAARAVGNILAKSSGLPGWRVVGSGGRLKTGKSGRQAELLRNEGLVVEAGRVVSGNR